MIKLVCFGHCKAVERAIRALVAWPYSTTKPAVVTATMTRCKVAIGALQNDSDLRLTPLGFHLAHMPVDVRIGTSFASILNGLMSNDI